MCLHWSYGYCRADNDARIALQLEEEERIRKDLEQIARNDNRLARMMQRQESQHLERYLQSCCMQFIYFVLAFKDYRYASSLKWV